MNAAPSKSIKVVGANEAKAKLPALLDWVERGREVSITRHHRSIARLVPAESPVIDRRLFDRLRALRARLAEEQGETNRDLVQAGRRI
jgi:prevent-host-death family protein